MPNDTPSVDDLLSNVETSFNNALPGIQGLLNLAPTPTRIIGFAAEGIFKGIRLGRDILAAQKRASKQLEDKIRAQDILRRPILVKLDRLDLKNFFTGPTGDFTRRSFPALGQFNKEIEEYKATDGNPSFETFTILRAAQILVPLLKTDPELERRSDLRNIFEIGLDPGDDKAVRRLVLEYVRLFPERLMSFNAHYRRMEGFWKDAVELELLRIDRATLEAQKELDRAIGDLVKGAIFGNDGFAKKALQFAGDLKINGLNEQLAELKAMAEAESDADKKTLLQSDIAKLEKRINGLAKIFGGNS